MAGLRLIEPNELFNLLNQETKYPSLSDPVFMLLIDARERDDYNESHIITAKCASKNNNYEYVAPFDSDLECKTHVVVYDNNTSSLDDSENPAIVCATKLWKLGSRNPVEVLNGGYETFSALYPFHRTQKIIYMPRDFDMIQTFPSEVIPSFLYLGKSQHGNIPYIQKELRVKAHINCCEESGTFFTEIGESLLHIPVSDKPVGDLFSKFGAAVDFINSHKKNNEVVLIYSQLGISRSATITIAYLMFENNWSLEVAYSFVRKCRPQICPNSGFMSQLAAWGSRISRMHGVGITDSVYQLDMPEQINEDNPDEGNNDEDDDVVVDDSIDILA